MAGSDTAELLAALEAVRGFLEQTVHNNRTLVDAMRAGRRPTDEQLAELVERQRTDERELARFLVRLEQLRALQVLH